MSAGSLEERLRAAEDSLAARLQRLEDERELRELLSRYGFTADLGRSREYVDLYTEDGSINLGDGRDSQGSFVGHEKLMEFILGKPHKCIEGYAQHHAITGPVIFHIDGDEAVAEGYSLVIVQSDVATRQVRSCFSVAPEINVAGANFNRWAFRREGGRWRIVERLNRSIGTPEIHDVIVRSLTSTRPDADMTGIDSA